MPVFNNGHMIKRLLNNSPETDFIQKPLFINNRLGNHPLFRAPRVKNSENMSLLTRWKYAEQDPT